MAKVILVNPSVSTVGYSFITPRWLYVMAQATPVDLVGDPILVDESIERFDPQILQPGDIVGISISSGNCLPGYRVLREAKLKGTTVIMGGIHTTIFPDEPLRMGADAVVTGGGEVGVAPGHKGCAGEPLAAAVRRRTNTRRRDAQSE